MQVAFNIIFTMFCIIRIATCTFSLGCYVACDDVKRELANDDVKREVSRLCDLAILSIEKEISRNLGLDEVVDMFAVVDHNKRIVLS